MLDLTQRQTQSARAPVRVKRHPMVGLKPTAYALRAEPPLAKLLIRPAPPRLGIEVPHEVP